jgi:hypothetical protein
MNMQINSRSALSAMYRPSTSSAQSRVSSEAQKVGGDSSDKVTISQDAMARLAESQTLNQSRVSAVGGYRDAVIRGAEADPAAAEKMASELAYDTSYSQTGPLVDISNMPKITYTYTGEPVTDENMAAFKSEAAKVSAGRLALYSEEKTKGTPDAQIIKKIFDYDDQQSERYQKITGTYDFVQDKLAGRASASA